MGFLDKLSSSVAVHRQTTNEIPPKTASSDTERSATSMSKPVERQESPPASRSQKQRSLSASSRQRKYDAAPTRATTAPMSEASAATSSTRTAPKRSATTSKSTPRRTDTNALKPTRTASSKAPRPGLLPRRPTYQTQYMDMLLHLDTIPRLHNILASAFTWVLLAGYLVFPGTFESLQDSDALKNAQSQADKNKLEKEVLGAVNNAPLLWIAGACCIVGGCGMIWLWITWRKNYIWLINRIFLPGFMNSLAGIISTLINVYTAQAGQYSVTARVTIAVTGACTVILAIIFAMYNFIILKRVKAKHRREVEAAGGSVEEDEHRHDGEGLREKVQRKAKQPALEPGSVV